MDLMLTQDDQELIRLTSSLIELGSSASLDASPNKNWVENSGGLPPFIREVARELMKKGKTKSSAIAIAVSQIKKWAAKGNAKAVKALAEWVSLRAKNKARKIVKASHEDGGTYLMFSNVSSYNTDIVRTAWEGIQRERREGMRAQRKAMGLDTDISETVPYTWIKELWTDFIIINSEERDGINFTKVPYTVDSNNDVTFGSPVPIEQKWVEADYELDADDLELLADVL